MRFLLNLPLYFRPLCISLFCLFLASCALTQSQSFWASDRVAELDKALSTNDFERADSLIASYDGTLSSEVALDLAIRDGNVAAVDRYAGPADVNLPLDADGVTPLIRAVRVAPGKDRELIVRRLLKAGADPRKTDNFGRNPINYAGFGGDPALARFLESGGSSYYNSQAGGQVEWLPELAWQASGPKRPKSQQLPKTLLSGSPLKILNTGRPDLLFASAWIPAMTNDSAGADLGPFAGFRFHADGTGSLMRFFPAASKIEARDKSHVAWDFYRDHLYFTVLTNDYAAYCRSTEGAAGRFGVSCTNYSAGGGDVGEILSKGLSPASAKALLNSASERALLQRVGRTTSVLDAAAGQVCKPRLASKKLRGGLPARAAKSRTFGDWVVFDQNRFKTFSSKGASVCTQRAGRMAALRACKKAGGGCRSVGGCTGKTATAVASVAGHKWAWLSCHPDPEAAKRQALAKCREKSGCDCQIIYADAERPSAAPRSCRRRS